MYSWLVASSFLALRSRCDLFFLVLLALQPPAAVGKSLSPACSQQPKVQHNPHSSRNDIITIGESVSVAFRDGALLNFKVRASSNENGW